MYCYTPNVYPLVQSHVDAQTLKSLIFSHNTTYRIEQFSFTLVLAFPQDGTATAALLDWEKNVGQLPLQVCIHLEGVG